MIARLFYLLTKAIPEKLSDYDRELEGGDLATSEFRPLIELVVDKQFVKELFLCNELLVDLTNASSSDGKRKRAGRRSSILLHIGSTVDFICSCNIEQLLVLALSSCCQFRVSGVVVSRLFHYLKNVVGNLELEHAIGK